MGLCQFNGFLRVSDIKTMRQYSMGLQDDIVKTHCEAGSVFPSNGFVQPAFIQLKKTDNRWALNELFYPTTDISTYAL